MPEFLSLIIPEFTPVIGADCRDVIGEKNHIFIITRLAGTAPVYYEVETVHYRQVYNAGVFQNNKEAAVLTDKTVFLGYPQRIKNNINDNINDKTPGNLAIV